MDRGNSRHDGHNYNGPCHCGGGYMYHNYEYKNSNTPYRFFARKSTGSRRGSKGQSASDMSGREVAEIFFKMFIWVGILLIGVSPILGVIVILAAIAFCFH